MYGGSENILAHIYRHISAYYLIIDFLSFFLFIRVFLYFFPRQSAYFLSFDQKFTVYFLGQLLEVMQKKFATRHFQVMGKMRIFIFSWKQGIFCRNKQMRFRQCLCLFTDWNFFTSFKNMKFTIFSGGKKFTGKIFKIILRILFFTIVVYHLMKFSFSWISQRFLT